MHENDHFAATLSTAYNAQAFRHGQLDTTYC